MSDTENSCRICRGEGTKSQPLLHPCKCRGSIRYIHQDCLLEWLKHSNKSTEQCDICNTPYKFRTIYDENMPLKIPYKFVWIKLTQIIYSTAFSSLSIFLYITCLLIQIPIFWKFIGRIYTYVIDGHLPAVNSSFGQALLYGELNLSQYNLTSLNITSDVSSNVSLLYNNTISSNLSLIYPHSKTLFKIGKFFDYTYLSGARYFLVFGFVNLALFIEHEWVVRDEGYTKLLLRKIGKEPRTKLVDMLQQALTGLRNDGENGNNDANENLQRVENLARAINDLQEGQNNGRHEEILRRAIEQDYNDNLLRSVNEPITAQADNSNQIENVDDDEEVELDNERRTLFIRPEQVQNQQTNQDTRQDTFNSHDPDSASDSDTHDFSGLHNNHREDQNSTSDQLAQNQLDNIFDDIIAARNGNRNEIQPEANLNNNNNNDNNADNDNVESDVEIEQNQDDFDDEVNEAFNAAAANNGGGNIFELLGFSLNLTTPILLMVLCDVVIAVYLFNIYLIPHVLGNTFASTIGFLLRIIGTPLINYLIQTSLGSQLIDHLKDSKDVKTGHELLDYTILTMIELIIKPIIKIFQDLFLNSKAEIPEKSSLTERILLLGIGYSLISFAIFKFMNSLITGNKPVMATPRKVYKFLFEITSTIKVFVIFAIEIFFFPVYCGWLLDFCIAPLLLSSFTSNETGVTTFSLLFTSSIEFLQINYIRVLLYWASGTLYMLFFALFVGMIRGQILRPGVLFFIRSPDDPNARLIHDALVKPFMLQLSRIYLSAKVYTGFILIGIGGITWGLRFFVSPSSNAKNSSENIMLPIQQPDLYSLIISGLVIATLNNEKDVITKYIRKYWFRAFEISCHKLRLSHFILNKPISQERGYIVYRNIWQQISGTALPNFSNPVNYKQAMKIFNENPTINACFIPDGNYTRVPDNDTVSRKFIKKLFVPVTKDDKLLGVNEPGFLSDNENEYDSESSDDDLNNDNNYIITYRPPNFKLRCLGLILMLWTFAVILLLSIIFIGLIFGRPISMVISYIPFPLNYLFAETSSFFKNQPLNGKLADIASIFIGLRIELGILQKVDEAVEKSSTKQQSDQTNDNNNHAIQGDATNAEVGGDNEIEDDQPNFFSFLVQEIRQRFNPTLLVSMLSPPIWSVFLITTYLLFIEAPTRYYFKVSEKDFPIGQNLYLAINILVQLLIVFSTFSKFIVEAKFVYTHANNPEEAIPLNKTINESGLLTIWHSIGLIYVPYYVMVAIRYKTGDEPYQNDSFDMLVRVGLISCSLLLRFVTSVFQVYNKLEAQIKNEKYVKGRAIENIELSEDE